MSIKLSALNNKFIPYREDGKISKNVVLLVHGRGGQLKLMNWFSKRFNIKDTDYVLIEAPFAEDVEGMKEPGFSWLIMPKHQGLDESRQRILQLIEQLVDAGYEHRNIYWVGFSQGGLMGLDTFLRSDKELGAVICVSGYLMRPEDYPEQLGAAARKQRFLATHGVRDTIVTIEMALERYKKFEEMNLQFEFREYNKPHSFELKKEIPELEEKLKIWMKS